MALWKCGGPTMLIDRNGASAFGEDGRSIADFPLPGGIATSTVKVVCAPSGGIFSLDAKTGFVQRVDIKDNLTQTIPDKETAAKCCGKGRGVPARAYDFAPEPSGGVFILDAKYGRVLKFDYDGKFRKIAVGDTRPDEGPALQTPALIATGPRGNVWLYDSGDRTIKVYDDFGYLRHTFIDTTSAGFAFITPVAMSIDHYGRLFILDSTKNSIRVFDVSRVN